MAVNQLIAQGLRPIGADAPQIANMLAQRKQQEQQNALAQQDMGIRQQNADAYSGQLQAATAARQAEATKEQYGYAARVGYALSQAKTPEEFAMLADRVASDPQYQSIPGVFTREQMTPENVRATLPQVFAKAGMDMPQAATPYSVTTQPGPYGSSIVSDGKRFDVVAAPAPKAPAAPKEVNKQLVTRPTPDGRQQDFAFNPQTSQLEPVGPAYDKAAPLSPKDTGVVKQKLIQISTARTQLATAKEKWKALQNSLSAGPGGGFLPTPAGKAFDAAIDGMRGSITALTRVPGVGAMSDYETRLDQAKFPERGNYEEVTAQKLDQLDALVNGLDTGYRDLLGGTSDTAAPAEASAPADGVVTVTSPAEAMKLPPGTRFKTPDGRVKVR